MFDTNAMNDGSTWKRDALVQTVDGDMVRRSTKFAILALAGLVLVGAMATPSVAQDLALSDWEWSSPRSAGTDPWRFSVLGYGWLPSAPATITTDSTIVNLPESFDKILDSLEFALMAEAEVHKGPFGVYVAPVYYDGKDNERFTGALGQSRKLTIEESVWVVDYGVSYELGVLRIGDDIPESPKVTLQPYVGGRYLHDNIKLDLDEGLLDQGLRIRETLEFNTPLVGFDTDWEFQGGWRFRLGGDYGGFNVDDVDETWQFYTALGYTFDLWGQTGKVFGGYRYLHIEYQKELGVELTVKGPLVGFGLEF